MLTHQNGIRYHKIKRSVQYLVLFLQVLEKCDVNRAQTYTWQTNATSSVPYVYMNLITYIMISSAPTKSWHDNSTCSSLVMVRYM